MAKKKTVTKKKTDRKPAAAAASRKQTKSETRSCSSCGRGTMRYERQKERLEYKGQTREIDTLAWWCDACDDGVIEGEALLARERAYFELRADVDGVLKPAEVTRIRKTIGISQREAGELLGGGPRAFQKYESGKTAVSVPMSNLLRLLAKDPKRLKELERREEA